MATTILAPYKAATAVTKSDSTIIPVTDALYIGGAGDVAVITQNGDSVIFSAVPVGAKLDLAVSKVLSTGTTATLILALYR